jgi:predicted kinase
MKKKLYLLVGPAGSGKTTWVREHATPGTSAHISRDRIRFSMLKEGEYYFAREDEVLQEFLNQVVAAWKCPWVDEIYVDATHLTEGARKKVVLFAEEAGCEFDLIAVVVKPSLEQCLEQNAKRTGRECVPEKVIRNMYACMTSPLYDDLHYDMIIANHKIELGKVEE